MSKYYLALFFIPLFWSVRGQCCSGGVPLSSSVGLPPAEEGSIQLNLNYSWNHLDRLKSGSNLLNDHLRKRDTHSLIVESGYTFSSKFSLDFFGSIVRQEREINTLNGNSSFVFTQGLGDIVLPPKYHINSHLVFGLGVKLPTGRANFNDVNGIALPADLQPGSGAIDWIPYAYYQIPFNRRPSLQFATKLTYRITGKNNRYFNTDNSYQFGNEVQWQILLSDQFVILKTLLDPFLGIRFRWAERDFFNTQFFPGSGGNFIFVSTGISVPLSSTLFWQWSTVIPLHSFVNETQLVPTLSLVTGLRWQFAKRKKPISSLFTSNTTIQ